MNFERGWFAIAIVGSLMYFETSWDIENKPSNHTRGVVTEVELETTGPEA